jgi:hypothetical protein
MQAAKKSSEHGVKKLDRFYVNCEEVRAGAAFVIAEGGSCFHLEYSYEEMRAAKESFCGMEMMREGRAIHSTLRVLKTPFREQPLITARSVLFCTIRRGAPNCCLRRISLRY